MTAAPPRIFKYTVPVDDQPHRIDIQGPILHVASQSHAEVQFWAMNYGDNPVTGVPPVPHWFQVVGTGQPIPRGMVYTGTALDRPFAWHLFRTDEAPR